MLFSGKGTPDCRRSFPIKCRACFGRVGLRDGYAVNGSSVFAESGFERNRSLFPAIVRIVVARLIYGGRLTIPAGFRERLCRTTPPDSLCPAWQAIPVCRGYLVTVEAGRKSLAAERMFSRKASFSFVTTGKAARCRRPWDRSSFRIVRLRGRNVSADAGSLLPFSLLRNLLLLSGGRRIAHDVGRRSGETVICAVVRKATAACCRASWADCSGSCCAPYRGPESA